ncbi:conjugative transfer signal peptidase TraF [Sinorhizobium medicae]|uniref:conjugative transfer signal peptidase TraF n=1 Tax=Sinorhizobium medicae TaxID=110321 RepID=UPI00119F8994|nr:conjugative transfer signal peptidase TraF [Sinorhizobium medicae]MDX0457623.1 conjugative transfer signal peptidase TraF [Sinorhizobium medicae]MDX0507050.1 conjugative transfer signal peptidase TraF [Sinorhizobium medicae]MDX0593529.1 conjugative transfer signal peptidase TraF [Sinorhizobium medicae]MDX0611936.1 conjugative transfer signal peptidase TraF [Sinorhizobium medicae]MDX0649069.1 conjugative transfer signal peptidase TraF [Sinorhizobium medicae]
MSIPLLQTAPTRRRGTPFLLGLAMAPLLFLGAISVAWFGGYRINLTPSEPLGLWRFVKLDRPAAVGDLVLVCPPQTAAMQEARRRGYLRAGLCPGDVAPLIKTVIAVAGQRVDVCVGVSVNGHPIPSSGLAQRDGQGRPMTEFPGGIVPANYVFLHSRFAGSYDSRYFGPVPASGILGLAQEVLTYEP